MPAGVGDVVVVQLHLKVAPASPVRLQAGVSLLEMYVVVETPGAAGTCRSTRTSGLTPVVLLPALSVSVTSSVHAPSPGSGVVHDRSQPATGAPNSWPLL